MNAEKLVISNSISHDNMTCLFGVSELVPVALVHAASSSLWITRHCFDVNLQTALQQLVHLTVVVIIISADAQNEKTHVHLSILGSKELDISTPGCTVLVH